MKVHDVFARGVVGREVGAAAEPERRAAAQAAEVGVHRRHHRALRVEHQRDSGGEEGEPVAGELRGKIGLELAVHRRGVDAAFFEQRAVREDAGDAAAAARALPFIGDEARAAVGLLQRGADGLQAAKKLVGVRGHVHGHHYMRYCGVAVPLRMETPPRSSRTTAQNSTF
jgi:hypothetical protein